MEYQGLKRTAALCFFALLNVNAWSQDEKGGGDLRSAVQNPISSLISLPFKFTFDYAANNGDGTILNVNPVVPVTVGDWNLVNRALIPVGRVDGAISGPDNPSPSGSGNASGLGDINYSLYFSPVKYDKVIWGAGPSINLPTASDDLLGSEKWGAGPTAVALKQDSGWTYGALANHIWSFAGEDNRDDISKSLVQPFLSYTTPKFTTYGINTESTYDWKAEQWSVPVNLSVTQLMKFGKQPVSLQAGVRYWADGPDNGPDDWGFRLSMTLLYPK